MHLTYLLSSATVSNITVTIIFTLIAGKRTLNQIISSLNHLIFKYFLSLTFYNQLKYFKTPTKTYNIQTLKRPQIKKYKQSQ